MNHDSSNPTGVPDDEPALALIVAYDGSGFAGFARQPGQRTVQGEIEQALSIVLRRPVEIVGAGRTDAGVHALGQVVSFPVAKLGSTLARCGARSTRLSATASSVDEIRWARPGFSARFDAISREYRYRIVAGRCAAAVSAARGLVDAARSSMSMRCARLQRH